MERGVVYNEKWNGCLTLVGTQLHLKTCEHSINQKFVWAE